MSTEAGKAPPDNDPQAPGVAQRPANVRDVGGLRTDSGYTVSGVILRGDAPYQGDRLDPVMFSRVETVIDLRGERELSCRPYVWPADVTAHTVALYDPGDLGAIAPDTTVVGMYAAMIPAARTAIAAIPSLIPESGTTYIHCTAGKDRTGVVTAALLALAGVEPDAILADYQRTEAAMTAVIARADTAGVLDRRRIRREWATTPAAALRPFVDELLAHPGGPTAWFIANGSAAADLERVRRRLRSGGHVDN